MGRRKIGIDEATLKKAEALAQRGLTDAEVALSLGLSERTFQRRKRDMAELAETLSRARARAEGILANRVWELALNGTGDVPAKVSLNAATWLLARRHGWTEEAAMAKAASEEAARAIPVSIDVKVDMPRADSPEMEEMRLEWQRQYELDHGLPVTVVPQLVYDKQED